MAKRKGTNAFTVASGGDPHAVPRTAPRAHLVAHEPTDAQRAFEAVDAAWWEAGCPLTGPLSDAWDQAWRAWQGGPL